MAEVEEPGVCAGVAATAARVFPKAMRHTIINSRSLSDTPKLDGDENTTAAIVGFMLHFHTLAKATLTGVWGH